MKRHSFSVPMLLLAALVALTAWDATGLDLPMARWFGGPDGFPLRNAWILTAGFHTGGFIVSWAVVSWLCIGVWFPSGPLVRLATFERLQLAITPLLVVLTITLLKAFTVTSCPWHLTDFGGVARLVSHWASTPGGDGGPGHCFPAGHASAGFAFVGGYFVFRDRAPRIAWLWLLASLLAGFTLGSAQQIRGAHFMSHTLWTAWICALVSWLCALAADSWRAAATSRRAVAIGGGSPSLLD
ncbi:MAG: phosphatase PAP2 family protein [Caldimonas sp.]